MRGSHAKYTGKSVGTTMRDQIKMARNAAMRNRETCANCNGKGHRTVDCPNAGPVRTFDEFVEMEHRARRR